MHITKEEIEALDRIFKINLVNGITGIKPANLIGTVSNAGVSNLAIISSVVHLSSSPALIGFMMRPHADYRRDTYNNIIANKVYTINHVSNEHVLAAHYTSAKFSADVSEFDQCGFTEAYINGFKAPFVEQSQLKVGLKLVEEIQIQSSGTSMIIGSVEQVICADEIIDESGVLNLEIANSVGISGLNAYYKLGYIDKFPFAREEEAPSFSIQK
jgi:flavin reductase (DIM6/NTAB) family NADH-FMN oxidoreductase RutF